MPETGTAAAPAQSHRRVRPTGAWPGRGGTVMIVGMLVSAAIAVFGLLVAFDRIGHPIDAQRVSNYGWSILIIGAALFVLFADRLFVRTREARGGRAFRPSHILRRP